MRMLLVDGKADTAATAFFERVGAMVRRLGADVDVVHDVTAGWPDVSGHDLLFSHITIPRGLDERIRCIGGREVSRPAGLAMLEDADVATMRWSLAASAEEVDELFDRWRTDRLLLKRSGSFAGDGTFVFDRRSIGQLEWRPRWDVFCAEVDEGSGDVYKAEILDGDIVIGWMSHAPPIAEHYHGGVHRGLKGAYGERAVHDFDGATRARMESFSRLATSRGLGYVSVDLMRRSDGRMVAIELNASDVATWWTSRFDATADGYARALARLAAAETSVPTATGASE